MLAALRQQLKAWAGRTSRRSLRVSKTRLGPGGVWLIVLGTLLVGQVATVSWMRFHRAPLRGPAMEEPLTGIGPVSVNGAAPASWASVFATGGSCTLIVFVEPTCGACRQMRARWAEMLRVWRDSVGTPVHAVWASTADSASLRLFVGGFDLGRTDLVRIVGNPDDAGRQLGIYATPTSYLLDTHGRLRAGVLGIGMPPADSGRASCAA
jgi:hypothetical protein